MSIWCWNTGQSPAAWRESTALERHHMAQVAKEARRSV